jgi:tRNA G18 (ribose-2'-O)-methylase SpoU
MSLTGAEKKAIRETDPFDRRNIRPEFKNMTDIEIKEHMKYMASGLVIVAVNIVNDFNVGSVVRSANAFAVDRVILTEARRYDKRGAVGAYNYIDVDFEANTLALIETLRQDGYRIVAAEYDENREMTSLPDFDWPEKSALVMGEEGLGLSDAVLDAVDNIVYIEILGTVRSLNVASCANTFMYAYEQSMTKKAKSSQ